MTSRHMSIGSMRGCECGKHVWLLLHEDEGSAHVGLRVHTELSEWFDPEKRGVTRLLEGITGVMRQAGREPRAVVVTEGPGRHVSVRLRIGGVGETDIECEPGVALLLAERTGLPILLQELPDRAAEGAPAESEIPEVYRETLAALGLLAEASD